jgi:hypothetical protein
MVLGLPFSSVCIVPELVWSLSNIVRFSELSSGLYCRVE